MFTKDLYESRIQLSNETRKFVCLNIVTGHENRPGEIVHILYKKRIGKKVL
jgi:hypothetical protein